MNRVKVLAFTAACFFSCCSAHVLADTLLFSTATNGTAFIDSGPLKNNIVDFSWVGDRAIYQGDIILNISKPGSALSQNSVVTTRTNAGWSNALVPFVIRAGVDRARVLQAIAHWQQQTPFKFVEQTADFFGDSIVFTPKADVCQSMVGRTGGPQPIELDSRCSKGTIIHEIGHAIGFLHEQSRNDRDQYVRIRYENIEPAMVHNFDIDAASEDVGTYDFASIMHYPLNAFSTFGLNTIEPIKPVPSGVTVGQRDGLSLGDKTSAEYLAGFRLQVASTDMCLHPLGGAAEPGNWTHLVTWPSCSKEDRISFQLTSKGSLRHISSGKCIHPEWGSATPADGTPAVFWDSCNETRLAFAFTASGQLKHISSGKCLGTSSDIAERSITFQTCSGAANQQFKKITGQTIRHVAGLCVASAGSNNIPAMNTPAILSNCDAGSILKFDVTASGLIYNSEFNMCLHPEGGSGTPGNGTRLVFFPSCTPDNRLKFKVTAQGSLQHVQSGKCIHQNGGATNPVAGTNLVLWDGCTDARLKYTFN